MPLYAAGEGPGKGATGPGSSYDHVPQGVELLGMEDADVELAGVVVELVLEGGRGRRCGRVGVLAAAALGLRGRGGKRAVYE